MFPTSGLGSPYLRDFPKCLRGRENYLEITSLEEYKSWLEKEIPVWPLAAAEVNFRSVSANAHLEFDKCAFISAIRKNLDDWNDLYYQDKNGYPLWPSKSPAIEINDKTFDSLINKTYRKNVILNDNWDSPPNDGWIRQDNWYEEINDLVRTQIVVKYMDGVEFLVEKLIFLAQSMSLSHRVDYAAKSEGYYAAHFYFFNDLVIPTKTFGSQTVTMSMEIQITTQLQDAIAELTHDRYVSNRNFKSSDQDWRWNHKDLNFKPSYLAHILHYVEGMILEIRDRDTEKEA